MCEEGTSLRTGREKTEVVGVDLVSESALLSVGASEQVGPDLSIVHDVPTAFPERWASGDWPRWSVNDEMDPDDDDDPFEDDDDDDDDEDLFADDDDDDLDDDDDEDDDFDLDDDLMDHAGGFVSVVRR